jgi:hypothetical protein
VRDARWACRRTGDRVNQLSCLLPRVRLLLSIHSITSTTGGHEPWRQGLQGFGGAHGGVVGSQALARWMDVAMSRWLGRRMKPIPVT